MISHWAGPKTLYHSVLVLLLSLRTTCEPQKTIPSNHTREEPYYREERLLKGGTYNIASHDAVTQHSVKKMPPNWPLTLSFCRLPCSATPFLTIVTLASSLPSTEKCKQTCLRLNVWNKILQTYGDTGHKQFCTVAGQVYDHHPCRHVLRELYQPHR